MSMQNPSPAPGFGDRITESNGKGRCQACGNPIAKGIIQYVEQGVGFQQYDRRYCKVCAIQRLEEKIVTAARLLADLKSKP